MEDNEVPRISCEELKQLIDKGEQLVVVDTRGRGGYDREHITGAINISYDASGDPVERKMMLTALPADRLIVIYCG